MAHLDFCAVARPCHNCKYTDCVTVCPMDCFYQDEMMLYIHPDECIDCGACMPECPVGAIFHAPEVPVQWLSDVELNRERTAVLKDTENITERQEPKLGPACKPA